MMFSFLMKMYRVLKELDGTYISARRPHHGFLTLYSYLMPLKVKAVNDHEIKLSIFNMSANYVQTSPYIYKKMNGHIMFDSNKSLFFHVKDGKVGTNFYINC